MAKSNAKTTSTETAVADESASPQVEATPTVESTAPEPSTEVTVTKTVNDETTDLNTGAKVAPQVITPFTMLVEQRQKQALANELERLTETDLTVTVSKLLNIDVTNSLVINNLIKRLVQYVNRMSPSSVTSVEDGIKMQHLLYDGFINVLDAKSDEALAGLQIIQYVFTTYKTQSMRRELVFRFMNMLRLNNQRNTMFQSLLHLFATIADMDTPNSSVIAQSIDLPRLAGGLLTDNARVNLLNYIDTLH